MSRQAALGTGAASSSRAPAFVVQKAWPRGGPGYRGLLPRLFLMSFRRVLPLLAQTRASSLDACLRLRRFATSSAQHAETSPDDLKRTAELASSRRVLTAWGKRQVRRALKAQGKPMKLRDDTTLPRPTTPFDPDKLPSRRRRPVVPPTEPKPMQARALPHASAPVPARPELERLRPSVAR